MAPPSRRVPAAALFLMVTSILPLGCSGSAAVSPAAIVAASPTAPGMPAVAGPSGSTATPGSMAPAQVTTSFVVTVGSQQIAVRCNGADTGLPTIVLMHGNGGGGQGQFNLVEPHLLTLSRVCTYDRPGTGGSPAPAKLPRPITDLVAEAHAVLAAAKIDSPVFLIGTSNGGALAFMYAQAYPVEVAGFVAINPNPPYAAWLAEAKKVETPEEVAILEEPDYRGENPEGIDNRPTSSMLTNLFPASMPYALMFDETCGGDTAFCAKVYEPLKALDEKLAHVGALGRFISLPGADHDIERTRPSEVNKVVDEIWGQAVK